MLLFGGSISKLSIKYVIIQVALLHICRTSGCKKISGMVSNQGFQLAAFILPKNQVLQKLTTFLASILKKFLLFLIPFHEEF